MIYAVLFEDDDSHADMRVKHMTEHLAFLERNARNIQAAGPLTDAVDRNPAGGLWLVEADSPQAVRELIENDPFWPTGLRKSIRVLQWTQVFADGRGSR
jgi:uncharacterized protein YciI